MKKMLGFVALVFAIGAAMHSAPAYAQSRTPVFVEGRDQQDCQRRHLDWASDRYSGAFIGCVSYSDGAMPQHDRADPPQAAPTSYADIGSRQAAEQCRAMINGRHPGMREGAGYAILGALLGYGVGSLNGTQNSTAAYMAGGMAVNGYTNGRQNAQFLYFECIRVGPEAFAAEEDVWNHH